MNALYVLVSIHKQTTVLVLLIYPTTSNLNGLVTENMDLNVKKIVQEQQKLRVIIMVFVMMVFMVKEHVRVSLFINLVLVQLVDGQ